MRISSNSIQPNEPNMVLYAPCYSAVRLFCTAYVHAPATIDCRLVKDVVQMIVPASPPCLNIPRDVLRWKRVFD